MSGPICEWAVSASSLHCMFLLSLSAWVDPSVSWLHWPCVCIMFMLSLSAWVNPFVSWLYWPCVCIKFLLSLSAWVDPSVSGLYLPRDCIVCSCCHSRHEWTHLWVGCIAYVVTASSLHCMFLLSLSAWVDPSVSWLHWPCVCIMFMLSLSAWVDPSVSWLYLPHVCIVCSCCHSQHECTHLWVGCICLVIALYVLVVTLSMSGPICEWAVSASCLHYVLVVTLGMSGPICELAVSASCVHHMLLLSLSAWVNPFVSWLYWPCVCIKFLLSLSAWVDPSVSGLHLPRVCIVCSCCHSRHEWTHLWVGCIGLAFALCSCCHSRHEWTHLWVGCICLMFALYVLVVTLSMSVLICEWAVSVSWLHCMFLLSLSAWVDPSVSGLYLPRVCIMFLLSLSAWVDPSVSWLYLPECALFVLVVTLGMSGPVCECTVSASYLSYMFLLSLSAWVDQSVSGMYLPRACIVYSCCHSRHECTRLWVRCIGLIFELYVCSCCHSRHEWTNPWVRCIGFAFAVYALVVTLSMSEPICEWAVSALSVRYLFLLSLLAWVDPSVSALYRLRVCIICPCCYSRHEWTHLWVGCIGLAFALSSCCHSRHEWTHLWVRCIGFAFAVYALVVTLGISGPICELAVSALGLQFMFLLSLLTWVDPSVSGLYLPRLCYMFLLSLVA